MKKRESGIDIKIIVITAICLIVLVSLVIFFKSKSQIAYFGETINIQCEMNSRHAIDSKDFEALYLRCYDQNLAHASAEMNCHLISYSIAQCATEVVHSNLKFEDCNPTLTWVSSSDARLINFVGAC